MGLVGPPQLAQYTKGQMAILAHQGCVSFGDAEPPTPLPKAGRNRRPVTTRKGGGMSLRQIIAERTRLTDAP